MPKQLSLVLLLIFFSFPVFCQVKDIIDRDIKLIHQVPQFCDVRGKRELKSSLKKFRKENPQYYEIAFLDTAAIPYLIEKISDTTTTSVVLNCSSVIPYNLKTGDIAFQLFKSIVVLVPMNAVAGIQWDYIGCDELCNYISS